MRLNLLSLGCIAAITAIAQGYEVAEYTVYGKVRPSLYACGIILPSIGTFCGADVYTYPCLCSNPNAIMTMTGCLAANERNNTEVYTFYSEYCAEWYNGTFTADDLVKYHERYLQEARNVSEIPDFNVSATVDFPVLVTNVSFTRTALKAYELFLGNYDDSMYYGAGCVGYWLVVIVIATVCHWGVRFFPNLRDVFNGTFSKLFRKYITLPALAKRKRNVHQKAGVVFDFLVPTRMESLVVFTFFWLLFILCAVNMRYFPGDPIFLTKAEAITRYISDRTGIVCTVLTPLLILFAGRNNIFQWFTGWKYSTMLIYHRWVARIVVAMAFVHSVGYTWMYIEEGYYIEEYEEDWFLWGVIATACGGLLCFQALLFLRRRAYETFLVLHILLAVFFIIGLWFHVVVMGYADVMYACSAVWFADRFVRFVRVLWFGFPKATLTLLPDETLKIEVAKPKLWPATSGGHAWIHFMLPLTFWQNHPFTFIKSTTKDNHIVFFCKAKKGITHTLCKKLQNLPGKSTTMRVAVEGPYGSPAPVSNHSSAVFVAGGSGIPGIYSEAVDMAAKSKDSNRKTKLYWIVRELTTVAGFTSELQALKSLDISTVICVTRPIAEDAEGLFTHTDLSSLEKDKVADFDPLARVREEFPHIEFRSGRPELSQLIVEEIAEAANSVAFITCGHPVLVDDLRYEVVNQIDHTNKRLDFYEQLQIWA